ncbi:hypothetical protein PG994_008987 [Apiospora phragmitis]|uniref:DUF4234 domain-containing protein n=1 Tax=Apiospora phragmitis TaxID=2905665 RepID=A0ABR1UI13_9PEZI
MAWSSATDLTVEEQIGFLALLVYLNLGIAWYYFSCRKSQKYKDFKHRVIGWPPPPAPWVVAAAAAAGPGALRRRPTPRRRFASTRYALKRWGFVTASVLFWIVYVLLQLAIPLLTQLGGQDGGRRPRGIRTDLARRAVEVPERVREGVGRRGPLPGRGWEDGRREDDGSWCVAGSARDGAREGSLDGL